MEPKPAPAPVPVPPVATGPSRGPTLAEGNAPAEYPIASRRRNEQGTALVRARVGTDGSVERVELAQSSGSAQLDESALAAVRGWRFLPALERGTPVVSEVDLPVVFRLRPRTAASTAAAH